MPRHLVAACALGLLVLSGCGGEPEKPEPTRATASPTSTTPAAPVTPQLPEAARANSKAGANEFVRYYFRVLNHAQTSGSTDILTSRATTDCESCASWASRIDDIYESGGSIEGGAWKLQSLVVVGRSPAVNGWTFSGSFNFGKQTVVEGDPPVTKRFDGGGTHATIHVSWRGEQWKIAGVIRHS